MEALIISMVIIFGYLIGNINIALIISKIKKQDVRKMGSGNPGSMNMFRNYGIPLGLLTLILDALKGVIPSLLGWFFVSGFGFGADRLGLYIGGLSVIVGHIFPVFLKFKGGKGIASTIGVCLVAQPILTPITFTLGVLFLIVTKMGSITSFIIITVPLILEGIKAASLENLAVCILIFALFSLTLFAHRKNVVKLFNGKENQTVLFGKNKSVKQKQAKVQK